jgi:hypothetical protein
MQAIADCPTDEGKEELEVALGHTIISYFGCLFTVISFTPVKIGQLIHFKTKKSKSYFDLGVKSNCIDY